VAADAAPDEMKVDAMNDTTVCAVPQVAKPENSGLYRSTPYQYVSTSGQGWSVQRVGKPESVGIIITKKPFTTPVRPNR
jgi:hypothetical protein